MNELQSRALLYRATILSVHFESISDRAHSVTNVILCGFSSNSIERAAVNQLMTIVDVFRTYVIFNEKITEFPGFIKYCHIPCWSIMHISS